MQDIMQKSKSRSVCCFLSEQTFRLTMGSNLIITTLWIRSLPDLWCMFEFTGGWWLIYIMVLLIIIGFYGKVDPWQTRKVFLTVFDWFLSWTFCHRFSFFLINKKNDRKVHDRKTHNKQKTTRKVHNSKVFITVIEFCSALAWIFCHKCSLSWILNSIDFLFLRKQNIVIQNPWQLAWILL